MKAEIIYILDRSGSMASIWDDAFNGLNQFIEEQKKVKGKCNFSLVAFDNHYEVIIDRQNIKSVSAVSSDMVSPRGSTALLDAIGKTLATAKNKADKTIVVIMTDGHENSSIEYTKDSIKSLIDEKKKSGWEFIFMGADQDSFAVGGALGINQSDIMNFDKTKDGTLRVSNFASAQTESYRR